MFDDPMKMIEAADVLDAIRERHGIIATNAMIVHIGTDHEHFPSKVDPLETLGSAKLNPNTGEVEFSANNARSKWTPKSPSDPKGHGLWLTKFPHEAKG